MAEAHERPRFVNSATYAVVVNVTVAGGARRRTAYRRAEKIAERLADMAARAADVVAVSAVTGPVGTDGEIICPTTVAFSRANTGAGRPGDEGKLTRYLDLDHERARASLVAADARYRAEQRADRERRRMVGCPNLPSVGGPLGVRVCGCVYCDPAFHLVVAQQPSNGRVEPPRCLCGVAVGTPGERCRDHRDLELTVLNGDPQSLHDLADLQEVTSSPSTESEDGR